MARLFRGYPLIGIHRGLSRLAVFPTHFLIMLVDFLFYTYRGGLHFTTFTLTMRRKRGSRNGLKKERKQKGAFAQKE